MLTPPRKKEKSGPLAAPLDRWEQLPGNRQRILLLVILALLLAFIIVPKGGLTPAHYASGDIVARDVKAPVDLAVVDPVLTDKKRNEAVNAVRPLYDYDPSAGPELAQRMSLLLQLLRGSDPEKIDAAVAQLFPQPLEPADLAALRRLAGAASPETLRQMLARSFSHRTLGNLKLFQADLAQGVVLRNLVTREERTVTEFPGALGLGEVQDKLRDELRALPALSRQDRERLLALLSTLVRPNVSFNQSETEGRRKQAAEGVTPVFFQIKKGEMIVREGERISEDQVLKLRALVTLRSQGATLRTGAALFICILTLGLVMHRFARHNIRKYRPDTRDFLFLCGTFLALFITIKLAIFIAAALESTTPYVDLNSYYYLFPFAFGAMLVRIVLNSEVALVFSLLAAALFGLLFGNSLPIALYALAGSLAGAHGVGRCQTRSVLYRAALQLGLVNLVMILGLHLLGGFPFDLQLAVKLGFGLLSGLLCAVIVNGTIPLVEVMFKYTTDIKLLELANMNSPMLRELMIQAPGTYHHAIVVGNLVEAAAETISANPLLARVAAYYHDIGKIRKPLYFVENTRSEEKNRHDKLSPSMSALILTAHVKDGVELAREHRLGKELIDIIRQHHGTALIKFFYDKARSQADPEVQQVEERDYRYPGPKPQTREAALIMLADAVEAASRTLADPTPARIQGMVQKIINNIFIDGQLDECELTLKDLHNIAKSFNRILAGIFHHRIDYPEPAFKERDRESGRKKNGDDTHRESPKEPKDRDGAPAQGSAEDLKRLGMS